MITPFSKHVETISKSAAIRKDPAWYAVEESVREMDRFYRNVAQVIQEASAIIDPDIESEDPLEIRTGKAVAYLLSSLEAIVNAAND